MGRELELKYEATPEILDEIRMKYPNFAEISMHTRYFDTSDHDLHRRKWTLRLRTENGFPVCTLKTRLPDGSRGEFEVRQAEISIPALLKAGAPAELEQLAKAGLQEICGAEFVRHAVLLSVPGGQVELALDTGRFTAGNASASFCEVEVELKAGEDSALYRFGEAFSREFSLSPASKSKSLRAMDLAEKGML